ncbi:MAG: protein phosphatase 2C domain-containing protein [Deltaproteobacteria bacterium]|jgi:serine/threonine protein phosphatase PrpC|nr:protein phosphatase 2C domain-containing protein [Deltaproteobacteria bacterium]
METYGLSHTGLVREHNEDRFLIKNLSETTALLAVADGMGGHCGGEIAAQIVIDTLQESDPATPSEARHISRLLAKANETIHKEAERTPALLGMGTTATVALIDHSLVHWAHVGDSRLYFFGDGRLKQVTTDQNMAQMLIERGEISPEQARLSPYRNMLLQCVGGYDCVPASGHFEINRGDLLLLCTDGLCGAVPRQRIRALLAPGKSMKTTADSLLQAALDTGGKDNITVVLARPGAT